MHQDEKLAWQAEFRKWLQNNKSHLRSYHPDEVAAIALTCGFPMGAIWDGITDKVMVIKRCMEFAESEIFGPKWMRLVEIQNGTDEEEDPPLKGAQVVLPLMEAGLWDYAAKRRSKREEAA